HCRWRNRIRVRARRIVNLAALHRSPSVRNTRRRLRSVVASRDDLATAAARRAGAYFALRGWRFIRCTHWRALSCIYRRRLSEDRVGRVSDRVRYLCVSRAQTRDRDRRRPSSRCLDRLPGRGPWRARWLFRSLAHDLDTATRMAKKETARAVYQPYVI